MKSNYELFVINLDRSKDRLENFKKSFKNYKINRISAIDGKDLTIYEDKVKIPDYIPRSLLPIYNYENWKYYYASGCSHIYAIYQAYLLKKEGVIICEDDLRNEFEEKWNNSLDNIINNMPKDCECLTLFSANEIITEKMINMNIEYTPLIYNLNGDRDNWHTSACCYFINKSGMEKIVNQYIKNNKVDLTFTQDLLIADFQLLYPLMNTYHYTKPLFIDECSGSFINDNFYYQKLKNKSIVLNYFNNICKKDMNIGTIPNIQEH